jgi:hypothetical protein
MVRVPGQVLGTPGGSLTKNGSSFAANAGVAKAGANGERRTAEILNALAAKPGGPTVLHDLRIPGSNANVDHVVVSGRTVTIIDTKAWLGDLYWTIAGHTFRGLRRFVAIDRAGNRNYPAEKRTLSLARDRYAKHLGVPAISIRISLIIWPTGARPLNLLFFRGAGNPKTINGLNLTIARAGWLYGKRPADPTTVHLLAQLIQ